MSGPRLRGARTRELRDSLLPRDIEVLSLVAQLKLVTGAQIEVLHFAGADHANPAAAGRACRRVLQRLVRDRLLARLDRRVGGVRGGSSGFIYCLTETGQRVLELHGPRRRFREPTSAFVAHTLAVAQLVVDLHQAHRAGRLEILALQAEPACWRHYGSLAGTQHVRPDLFVALGVGEYEHHWFVEIDLGSETLSRRISKCRQYEAYYRSGIEQATHDLFPRILWAMPSQSLADQLAKRIQRTGQLNASLFATASHTRTLSVLSGSAT